jgi:hypothetical protein
MVADDNEGGFNDAGPFAMAKWNWCGMSFHDDDDDSLSPSFLTCGWFCKKTLECSEEPAVVDVAVWLMPVNIIMDRMTITAFLCF